MLVLHYAMHFHSVSHTSSILKCLAYSLERSIYRTIELANGWTGRIIRTQRYFSKRGISHSVGLDADLIPDFLDGMMIIFAILCLNFLHPGYLLHPRQKAAAKF